MFFCFIALDPAGSLPMLLPERLAKDRDLKDCLEREREVVHGT